MSTRKPRDSFTSTPRPSIQYASSHAKAWTAVIIFLVVLAGLAIGLSCAFGVTPTPRSAQAESLELDQSATDQMAQRPGAAAQSTANQPAASPTGFHTSNPSKTASDPSVATITIKVDGYTGTLPTLHEGVDFTLNKPVGNEPQFMVDDQGNQPLAALIESQEKQGKELVWHTEGGASFDWFTTPITASITVVGSFQDADYHVRVSFNDNVSPDLDVVVPHGSSFKEAYGSIPETPSKTGYAFAGWIDDATKKPFDFEAPITSSANVYATYTLEQPDQVVTVDVTADIEKELTGRCYIGATWSVHPAQFSLSNFTGGLEGCSGTGWCALPSAAAPSDVWADYHATLREIDVERGIVTYDVIITPPDAASPNGPRNSLGLIGYQTVGFTAEVQKNFGGYLEVSKQSANTDMTSNNPFYAKYNAAFEIHNAQGELVQRLETDDSGNGKSTLLPMGTYTLKEIQPPKGYALASDTTFTIQAGQTTQAVVKDQPQSALIDLILNKVDAETGKPYPLGTGTLQGAQFRINYYANVDSALSLSDLPKTVSPEEVANYGNPTRSWLFESDDTGSIAFDQSHLIEGDPFYTDSEGKTVLPLGYVMIEEVTPPHGYTPLHQGSITALISNGTEEHIQAWQAPTAPEQVIRGDFSFTKVRAGSMEHLAHIPFLITSKTTGEAHTLYTDDNGMASTHSSWVPHTQNTNAGSSWQDGIWFGQDTHGNTTQPNDNLGALPFDTYVVEELPCDANRNMKLAKFEITISRDNITLDMGTVDNTPHIPEIGAEIDKRQSLLEQDGRFTYTIDYRSTSPTWADEFTVTDTLSCVEEGLAHLTKLQTPVSFEDYNGYLNVWYRTAQIHSNEAQAEQINTPETQPDQTVISESQAAQTEAGNESQPSVKPIEQGAMPLPNACASNPYNPDNPSNQRMFNFEGWKIWASNISTLESQTLSVDDLHLQEGEYVTAVAFEHGRVEEGFGTLPPEAPEWQRRDHYSESDLINNEAPDYRFDTQEAIGKTHTDQSVGYLYQPATLYLQATEAAMSTEANETNGTPALWNDADVDIYRNMDLHDHDKDSVVQNYAPDNPVSPPSSPIEAVAEEVVSHLPKTGQDWAMFTGALTLIALGSGAAIVALRNKLQRQALKNTLRNRL